jgi:hypothetical protein
MITNKQEQGFKILNSIVVSEFPFIKKVEPIMDDLYKWAFSFDVILHIDILVLSKILDIELSERFSNMDKEKLKMLISDWNSWNLSYVYHFFKKDYDEELGNKFNKKLETFMSRLYSQLPKDLRINEYENHPDRNKSELHKTFNSSKTIEINKMVFYV